MCLLLLMSCELPFAIVTKKDVFKLAEMAYFEGQKDAINGDMRIAIGPDSIYYWTHSPWDTGRTPIYNPTYLDSH